ncbi:MAG: amidohydrolase family protein [Opitutaceae bacterium]
MNRRRFVSGSAIAAAAIALPRSARAANAPARIPIGFLGVTYSHGPAKLELALKSPDWEFVGACDPTPAGRQICAKLGAKMISQDELFARAAELDLPVLLHPAKPLTIEFVKGYEMTSSLGNMFDNTIALTRLIMSGLLDEFPTLKLVCPHLGGTLPYIVGRLDHQITVLKRGPQNLQRKPSDYVRSIYMDIVSPLPEAMRFALDFSGPDKLLFSSDHPWVQPKEILDPFLSLKLSAATEAKILSGNARKLFKV